MAVQSNFLDTLRIVRIEGFLTFVCVLGGLAVIFSGGRGTSLARGITTGLLLWQAVTFFSAVRLSVWSHWQTESGMAALRSAVFNVSQRIGVYVTELRLAFVVACAAVFLGGTFYAGHLFAPQEERTKLGDPLKQFIPVPSVMKVSSADAAYGVLLQEADSARRGDIDAALRLWSPNGEIIDLGKSKSPQKKRTVWRGEQEIRERYKQEFSQRKYESLRHVSPQIKVSGNAATIVNGLDAIVDFGGKQTHLRLSDTDRWTLHRDGERWQIVRLEVNRGASGALAQGN
jgi:hypothetical protein